MLSHVVQVGAVRLDRPATWEENRRAQRTRRSITRMCGFRTEQRMKEAVDHAYRTGDTVGGIFKSCDGAPPGLGSHIAWDTRLDGKLAQAIVSIQAVKGVVDRVRNGRLKRDGSAAQMIHYDKPGQKFHRARIGAGGLEGGMTNGQNLF